MAQLPFHKRKIFRIRNERYGKNGSVPSFLDKQLAQFLRRARGDQTFAEFSRKLGLPPSTLYRLERCEQSVTLGRLNQIMTRLKCELADIFPKDAGQRSRPGRH
jgi:transcriptional regulator with XRE-family HTH domain